MGVAAYVLLEILRVLTWEGHARPEELIIKDKGELERIWANDGKKNAAPAVDFDKEMVVAVFSGEKATGHRIEIQAVAREKEGRNGVVLFKETKPDANAKASARKAFPSHVIVVPKAADVTFKFYDVDSEQGRKFLEAQKKKE